MENGRPIEDLGRLRPYARTLGIPQDLVWFKLSDAADLEASAVPDKPESFVTGPNAQDPSLGRYRVGNGVRRAAVAAEQGPPGAAAQG